MHNKCLNERDSIATPQGVFRRGKQLFSGDLFIINKALLKSLLGETAFEPLRPRKAVSPLGMKYVHQCTQGATFAFWCAPRNSKVISNNLRLQHLSSAPLHYPSGTNTLLTGVHRSPVLCLPALLTLAISGTPSWTDQSQSLSRDYQTWYPLHSIIYKCLLSKYRVTQAPTTEKKTEAQEYYVIYLLSLC